MAIFPKVQSPCPYKGPLSNILEGDMCRLCSRQVHDLTNFSDHERVAFLKGCAGEVCVSYKFPLRPALAVAAAIVALGAPMAAAQDLDVEEAAIVVTAGGITDPANVEYISDNGGDAQPELPVVTEAPKPASANSAEPATDGSVSRPNLGQSVEPE